MKKVHKTTLQEFCSKTTLHGWSFLGQTNIFWTIPGMFWSTIILFSVISTIFLMGTTIQGIPRYSKAIFYIIQLF